MNDMNFFAPLQTRKDKHSHSKIAPILLIGLLILIIAAPLAAFGYEMILTAQIASIQHTIDLPENRAVLEKLDALQARLDAITKSLPDLGRKDKLLGTTEWVTENTMQVIIDTVPKQVSANIMTMADGSVQIDGISVDKPAIAEMEYNLRKSGLAESVFVSHITAMDGGSYAYSINFIVKDVTPQ